MLGLQLNQVVTAAPSQAYDVAKMLYKLQPRNGREGSAGREMSELTLAGLPPGDLQALQQAGVQDLARGMRSLVVKCPPESKQAAQEALAFTGAPEQLVRASTVIVQGATS